jgi:hypothetical protein
MVMKTNTGIEIGQLTAISANSFEQVPDVRTGMYAGLRLCQSALGAGYCISELKPEESRKSLQRCTLRLELSLGT